MRRSPIWEFTFRWINRSVRRRDCLSIGHLRESLPATAGAIPPHAFVASENAHYLGRIYDARMVTPVLTKRIAEVVHGRGETIYWRYDRDTRNIFYYDGLVATFAPHTRDAIDLVAFAM